MLTKADTANDIAAVMAEVGRKARAAAARFPSPPPNRRTRR